MPTPNNNGNVVKRTSQYIDNLGFNEDTGLKMIEVGGTDGSGVNRLKINADGSINAVTGSTSATPNNVLMAYKSTDNKVIYIGEAVNASLTSAALWKITRLDTTTLLAVTYADGNLNFDNVWDNRESLTYT